jgi:TRAP-type C4-dicarboxylate transport system substrate-binding protein
MIRAIVAATLALAAALPPAVSLAQDRLSAVHAFPANWVYSRSFLDFVKKVNEAGKGTLEITVRGGPEAMGMFEQPNAVRNGVVDMVYTPCAFYAASVPECDAVSASSIDGPEARKNGATDMLNKAHLQRMGVTYLGWFDSGIRFHLWSTKPLKVDAQGNLDVKGFKVRGNPIYNAFLTNYLGAQVLNMPSTDMYTALERGTIELTGWTEIGLMDANWDKHIKYRLDPKFFSTDLGIIINAKKWDSLSAKSRDLLTKMAIDHEVSSVKDLTELRDKEIAELDKRGIKPFALSAEAGKRFVEGARSASYARMKERMDKMGVPNDYEKIVKAFAP